MRTAVVLLAILALVAPLAVGASVSQTEQKRLQNAATVLRDMHEIPGDILAKANCVGVIPSVKKAAFMVGGEYGKGVVSCRTATGWSAPAFFELEKGSWGLQIGGETIDLIFLAMNQDGIERLLQDKFALGGDGAVAAGPVGRSASAMTDVQMHAEILSYSRSQGIFAGIDLTGGVLMPDKDANVDAYGPMMNVRRVLIAGSVRPPAASRSFMTALAQVNRESQGQPAGGIR